MDEKQDAVLVISADAEWNPVRQRLKPDEILPTPYGEAFVQRFDVNGVARDVVLMHGGWGKIAAAASAQYAIDRWQPELLVNLGTCGGFGGDIARETIVLVDHTLVYDIVEQMGDPDEALAHYATPIDLSWLEFHPIEVERSLLISADRDIVVSEIDGLRASFGAVAADWESGAIAYVAARNNVRCLILRAVSDLVWPERGEAYEEPALFADNARLLTLRMLDSLPSWLAQGLPPQA